MVIMMILIGTVIIISAIKPHAFIACHNKSCLNSQLVVDLIKLTDSRHYGAIANIEKCSTSDIFKIDVTDGEDREEPGMSLVGSHANINGRTMVLHAKRDLGREVEVIFH